MVCHAKIGQVAKQYYFIRPSAGIKLAGLSEIFAPIKGWKDFMEDMMYC